MNKTSETICDSGKEGPVTICVSRKIFPGREQDYEEWVSGIDHAAGRFPGHQGVNVLRPSAATQFEYILIYRFDTYEHAHAWEHSDVRKNWILKLEGIVDGEETTRRGSGFEFWFELPEIPLIKPAPRYKMAPVVITVLYTLSILLYYLVEPFTRSLPTPLVLFFLISIKVLLMTYFIMPRVTKLLSAWLYR